MTENVFKYDDGEPIFLEDIKKLSDAQKEKQREEYEKRKLDLKDTFSTPEGTRVFFYLMHECYLFRNYDQTNASAYAKEGRREIANEIIDMVGLDYTLDRLITAKKLHTREKSDE